MPYEKIISRLTTEVEFTAAADDFIKTAFRAELSTALARNDVKTGTFNESSVARVRLSIMCLNERIDKLEKCAALHLAVLSQFDESEE